MSSTGGPSPATDRRTGAAGGRPATETNSRLVRHLLDALAAVLLVSFVLETVMLGTDQNLQTDFGVSARYYLHWYGVLVLALVTLIAAVVLLASGRVGPMKGARPVGRYVALGAIAWPFLAIAAMLGVLATYQQVGFTTSGQFAQFLFGVTPYPGALPYVPWLYDALLASYVVAAATGVVAAVALRGFPRPTASAR